ncbi:methionine-binding protein [Neisseria animaloris]|uniref:methionine-binding protein n=1 Tax=Neisseria animaloris TaxID=326522 RepID=UPI000F81E31C|nr:methionine-binding protein [Neisseria animaloris]
MKTIPLTIISLLLLGGCVYAETPDGRIAILDLPVQNETTVNKNVTINAPPSTTVIYQEAQPVSTVYPRPRRYYRY